MVSVLKEQKQGAMKNGWVMVVVVEGQERRK